MPSYENNNANNRRKDPGPPKHQQYADPVVFSGTKLPFGLTSYAQTSTNSQGITTTPPGFYSPPHTASAWQIPTARKEVYAWAKFWKDQEATVATGLDFYANFSMNGYKIECPNGAVKEYFEKLCKEKLHLDHWLPKIAYEYFLYGDCFVLLDMNCPKCRGVGRLKNGQLCDHEGASWAKLSVFDPNTIDVTPSNFITEEPIMHWKPDEQIINICVQKKPEEVYNQIPEEIREQIKAGQPIKMNPIAMTHLKFASSPYQTYGTSLLRRLFATLAYRDKLRQAQWLVAERHILPIKIVKIGSDQRPASEDDLAAVQEQLSQVANDPLLTLVVHHAFDFEYIGAAGKVLQLTNEYEMINEDILSGFQLNKALLHGEGPNYSSAQVGLDALAARLQTFRNEIKHWIEQKIFRPVAEWNNFKSPSPRGVEDTIYPEIVFNDLGLKDNNQEISNLLQLRNRGEVSLQTLLSKFDIDYDNEVELIRQEEMGNMLTSPDLGLGTTEGGDIGAGMGGGAPMPGGDMGMPVGDMGMPGMEGAAPGMEGAAPGMETPAPMASTLDMIHMYKSATADAKRIISEVNSDLSLVKAVNEMPEDLEYLDYDPEWLPLDKFGRDYIQMAKFASNPKDASESGLKKWFNKTEMLLFEQIYKANQSGQLPLAFVAGYYVGSNNKLIVDGAFPSLKIGIEVDGEKWHNDNDAIERDKRKDHTLWSMGWIVLRFTEEEIKEKIDQVMQVIIRVVNERYNKKD